MTDLFDAPSSSSGLKWDELNGRLLLVKPTEVVDEITTSYGATSAIRADIVVLDGPGAPEEITDTLIFPRVLQSQVRKNAGTGRMNLGRLGQGVKKPGQSAPWQMADPTDDDKVAARSYLDGKRDTDVPF